MKRFVLAGTPGAGKTAILRQLEVEGFSVVEEAATDVIQLQQALGVAEPWRQTSFIDSVVKLQSLRQACASFAPVDIQFHDRSVICTAALARYLEYPATELLLREIERIRRDVVFELSVFFMRGLGFITHTEARRISLSEAKRFELIHEETYLGFGFDLIFIEPASVADRAATIRRIAQTLLSR
jgi:predicted ATPase